MRVGRQYVVHLRNLLGTGNDYCWQLLEKFEILLFHWKYYIKRFLSSACLQIFINHTTYLYIKKKIPKLTIEF